MGAWVLVALLQDPQAFAARSDAADAIACDLSGVADVERRGQICLRYIQAMRSALGAIPMDGRDREPYHAFIQRHQSEAAYSEPAGQWMLTPDAIWTMHQAVRTSASAEAIAWEAVDNGMPGECEGYPPCELATLDALDGEYLRRHPGGAHAADVVKRIGDTCTELERLLSAPKGDELFNPVTDCVDLTPKASALESAMRATNADAGDALAALAAVRGRCAADTTNRK